MSAVEVNDDTIEDLEVDDPPMDYDHMVDSIIDTDFYCNGFLEEQGEPLADHYDADDFDLDDLIDMFQYTPCPLHVNPEYPYAPDGMIYRDVNKASEALDSLTEKHTGRDLTDIRHYDFHATATELREVWERFPHARWWYEKHAAEGIVTITVVEDE